MLKQDFEGQMLQVRSWENEWVKGTRITGHPVDARTGNKKKSFGKVGTQIYMNGWDIAPKNLKNKIFQGKEE